MSAAVFAFSLSKDTEGIPPSLTLIIGFLVCWVQVWGLLAGIPKTQVH